MKPEPQLLSSASGHPSVRLLRPLFAGAMYLGIDPLEVFQKAGVDPQAVALGKERIAPRAIERSFELAAEKAGADFGLRAAEAVDWRMFGNIGGASEHAFVATMLTRKTVREAIQAAEKYCPIGYGAGGYWSQKANHGLEVHFALERGRPTAAAYADHMVAWFFLALTQRADHSLKTARFSFVHPAPESRETYQRLLGAHVAFGEERDFFFIGEEDLRRPLTGYQPSVAQALMQDADRALVELTAATTLAEQVRKVLQRALAQGTFSGPGVAGQLGMSQRTLTRRLKAEGTSYQKLLDEQRASLAEHYLKVERLSASATAAKLGFSEASTFHRAFRRWFGQAPNDYRRG
jgi:AraC-like DNA-binding protein